MDNELIASYILWKRIGILNAIEKKKDFYYGIDKKNLKDFSEFAGQKLTIASMKQLEMLIEEKEDLPYVINKQTGKQYLFETWLESYFNPKVIEYVETNYDKYVQEATNRNMAESYDKAEFTDEVYRRIYEDENVDIVDIFGISLSHSTDLEFDKENKVIRYKGDDK